MPRFNKKWRFITAGAAFCFFSCVAVVGWVSWAEDQTISRRTGYLGVDLFNQNCGENRPADELLLCTKIIIDDFVPGTTMVSYRIAFEPGNALEAEGPVLTPTQPVQFLSDYASRNFAANVVMETLSVSNPTSEGIIQVYPFDKYFFELSLYAFIDNGNGSYGDPIDVLGTVSGSVQGFTIYPSLSQQTFGDQPYTSVSFSIQRTATTKAFAILIMIAMWILSLSVFSLASSVWWRNRKIEPTVINLCTALLFALPAIRSSQPGIPAIAGTVSDMTGFFFCLILVQASVVMLIWNYILKSKVPDPPKQETIILEPVSLKNDDDKSEKSESGTHTERDSAIEEIPYKSA